MGSDSISIDKIMYLYLIWKAFFLYIKGRTCKFFKTLAMSYHEDIGANPISAIKIFIYFGYINKLYYVI